MGSFNMFCAASNAPIHYGNKIVAYGLIPSEWHDTEWIWHDKHWHIATLAIHGTYDDYGRIKVDDEELGPDRSRLSLFYEMMGTPHRDKYNDNLELDIVGSERYPLMFMHEEVFNFLVTGPTIESWARDQRNEELALLKEYEAKEYSSDQFKEYRIKHKWNEVFDYNSKLGWDEILYGNYDLSMKYYNETKVVGAGLYHLGNRVAPSLYAGQTHDLSNRDKLNKIIENLKKEYEYEEDEFEEDLID